MECYSLSVELLALVVTAAIADSRSLAAVGLWAAAATTEHPASFGLVSGAAPQFAAAFDHGAVLGQVFVDAKSNEIPAARTLLDRFDLDGAVVAMDAPHAQTGTATLIQRGWRGLRVHSRRTTCPPSTAT